MLWKKAKPNCNETELGYTDNFQNKTAMTTPSNNEPANPKLHIQWMAVFPLVLKRDGLIKVI